MIPALKVASQNWACSSCPRELQNLVRANCMQTEVLSEKIAGRCQRKEGGASFFNVFSVCVHVDSHVAARGQLVGAGSLLP